MNPSRVIVGEVLGDEVVTMLNAMTQGNDGSLSTIHANSSSDVVHKIATYAIQAPERLPWEATVRLVATALDFIVFIRRVRAARTASGGSSSRSARSPGSARRAAGDQRAVGSGCATATSYDAHGVQVRCQDDLVAAGWRPTRAGGRDDDARLPRRRRGCIALGLVGTASALRAA